MGAVCTTKANREFNEERRHHQNITSPSPKQSTNTTQISLAKNDALFEQIRNAPDDPNLIIINDLGMSANASDADDLCFLDHNKSHTSLSLMLSPYQIDQQSSFQSINDRHDSNDVYHPPQQMMSIGDEIELIPKYNCLHGIIRFIGEIVDKNGIFYGLELNKTRGSDDVDDLYRIHFRKLCNGFNGFDANQDNGSINNICYFKADSNCALFVRSSQILRILRVNYDNPRIGINEEIFVPKYKCNGTVKYIGKHEFGIELSKRGDVVFLDSASLSHLIVPSRYNLLIHGYLSSKSINIASGIIRLISGYHDKIEIRLTSDPSRIIDNVICRKYEPFDINNNICGPSITVRYSGCNTHNTEFVTVITGYYQFVKSSTIDSGDYNTPWVNKTEFQIIQLKNGDRERIYRSINCDNEIPLMKDYKSIRTRFRHDIHADDVDLCDHTQILDHIAKLYGASVNEIKKELEKYDIELYGLRY